MHSKSVATLAIEKLLVTVTENVRKVLTDNLIGAYLFGSLTYDDFKPGRSDIDVQVFVRNVPSEDELRALQAKHAQLEHEFPEWQNRIEASYTPIDWVNQVLPPPTPRPYYGNGVFYERAPYGNEWLINLYLLRKYGRALYGPPPAEILPEIRIADVQAACRRDLKDEWQPKLDDNNFWLDNHYQSYLVLNLCRILFTIKQGEAVSKTQAADWVSQQHPQWAALISAAQNWQYGQPFPHEQESKQFLQWVLSSSNATLHALY